MRRFEAGDTIFLTGALNNSMIAVLEHDWDLGDKRDRGEICRRIVQGLLI